MAETRAHSGVCFIRALIPFKWTLPSGAYQFPEPHVLIPLHHGLEFQHVNLGGSQTFSLQQLITQARIWRIGRNMTFYMLPSTIRVIVSF